MNIIHWKLKLKCIDSTYQSVNNFVYEDKHYLDYIIFLHLQENEGTCDFTCGH